MGACWQGVKSSQVKSSHGVVWCSLVKSGKRHAVAWWTSKGVARERVLFKSELVTI